LIEGELDHVAVGVAEHAHVADRRWHLLRGHGEAAGRFGVTRRLVERLPRRQFDSQVGERGEHLSRVLLVRVGRGEELGEHKDERPLHRLRLAEPRSEAEFVLAPVEESQRREPLVPGDRSVDVADAQRDVCPRRARRAIASGIALLHCHSAHLTSAPGHEVASG
jgi:hypothetical protein